MYSMSETFNVKFVIIISQYAVFFPRINTHVSLEYFLLRCVSSSPRANNNLLKHPTANLVNILKTNLLLISIELAKAPTTYNGGVGLALYRL